MGCKQSGALEKEKREIRVMGAGGNWCCRVHLEGARERLTNTAKHMAAARAVPMYHPIEDTRLLCDC